MATDGEDLGSFCQFSFDKHCSHLRVVNVPWIGTPVEGGPGDLLIRHSLKDRLFLLVCCLGYFSIPSCTFHCILLTSSCPEQKREAEATLALIFEYSPLRLECTSVFVISVRLVL
ncbi:UNVERIFIED_CONTAM: hypothetical protein K2H54_031765 [Gekko kuhli]